MTIEVLLSETVISRLRSELLRAGSDEIGGVLAGEDVGDGQFSVVDISVQRSGGGFAHFIRNPSAHRRFMRRFFARTGNDYGRFNYLGEWHSHPSFSTQPSFTDARQMQQLVEDDDQQANFLVLVIAKLDRNGEVEASAHAFRRGLPPMKVLLRTSLGKPVKEPKTLSARLSKAWVTWRRESSNLTRSGSER